MRLLDIAVYGHPAPQGSKTFYGSSAGGKGRFVEASKRVKPWRQDVKAAAEQAIARFCGNYDAVTAAAFPLDMAISVRMVFSVARPKSHYRTGRNAHLRRDDAPNRPRSKPDLSKLLRSTEDALKDAGLYKDDSLIVEYSRAAKVYVGEDPEALDRPGVRIRIETKEAS